MWLLLFAEHQVSFTPHQHPTLANLILLLPVTIDQGVCIGLSEMG